MSEERKKKVELCSSKRNLIQVLRCCQQRRWNVIETSENGEGRKHREKNSILTHSTQDVRILFFMRQNYRSL